ncbi:MAG: lysophospholipid acyltransferase family protein [Bacteroidales bacterium]|nr:lysophospholipid acyltransferase family protein [Bacteroidales bacterium]
MIKATHNILYVKFFDWYLKKIIKSDFEQIYFNQLVINENKPLLILANHISWWDGFFMWYVNKKYIQKKIHVLMLEEELEKRKFLSKIGAFSIKRKKRKIFETFEYITELLSKPENLVIIYPQGIIESSYNVNIEFEKGIFKIFDKLKELPQIWLGVSLTDYATNRKPSVYIYFKEYISEKDFNFSDFQEKYREHYNQSIEKQIKTIKTLNLI